MLSTGLTKTKMILNTLKKLNQKYSMINKKRSGRHIRFLAINWEPVLEIQPVTRKRNLECGMDVEGNDASSTRRAGLEVPMRHPGR